MCDIDVCGMDNQQLKSLIKQKENFKCSDIENKIYKRPVSVSQLSKIVFKI